MPECCNSEAAGWMGFQLTHHGVQAVQRQGGGKTVATKVPNIEGCATDSFSIGDLFVSSRPVNDRFIYTVLWGPSMTLFPGGDARFDL